MKSLPPGAELNAENWFYAVDDGVLEKALADTARKHFGDEFAQSIIDSFRDGMRGDLVESALLMQKKGEALPIYFALPEASTRIFNPQQVEFLRLAEQAATQFYAKAMAAFDSPGQLVEKMNTTTGPDHDIILNKMWQGVGFEQAAEEAKRTQPERLDWGTPTITSNVTRGETTITGTDGPTEYRSLPGGKTTYRFVDEYMNPNAPLPERVGGRPARPTTVTFSEVPPAVPDAPAPLFPPLTFTPAEPTAGNATTFPPVTFTPADPTVANSQTFPPVTFTPVEPTGEVPKPSNNATEPRHDGTVGPERDEHRNR